jgi:hypothetical protein
MKFKVGIIAILVVLLACSKDKFQTKPQIEIKSTGPEVVPVNGTLNVRLEFRDKEGDVDGILFIYKERLNQRVLPTVRDSIERTIPEFPDKDRGEIELDLTYQNYLISASDPSIPGNPGVNEPDTLRFKFVVQDKAGNQSDPAILNNIVIIR